MRPTPSAKNSPNHIYRKRWLVGRQNLESKGLRCFPLHENRKIPLKDPMAFLFWLFSLFLKLTPFFKWGMKNAKELHLIENEIATPALAKDKLPVKILHLSDLHLDESIFDFDDLLWKLKEVGEIDFCCLTGDLVTGWPQNEIVCEKIKALITTLKAQTKHQLYYVLGNHDSWKMVSFLEELGITVLTNQLVTHNKSDNLSLAIEFIGTDDPHYFYQKDAIRILEEGQSEHFRVALVHTPELYREASLNSINLYLCGHTHGGQIALPGGVAIIRRVYRGKRYAYGPWKFGPMYGYTTSGVGTSSIPVRFNTKSEVVLHTIVSSNQK